MIDSQNHVVVGRFGRVFGVRGYITVHSFTRPRDNILDYSPWFALIGGKLQRLEVLDKQSRPKSAVALIEGYQQREAAASLVNVYIAIERNQLPGLPQGQYYWDELIGLQVSNQQGIEFGVVKNLMNTGSTDVLIVEGERRRLIPFQMDRFIISVDLEQKHILVDWDADL